MYKSIFIDDTNKADYILAVLTWLQKDFNQAGNPDRHFWHNRNFILDCFAKSQAMVAIDSKKNTVGFMIWSMSDISAEIDIVEVHKKHRRKGIYKMMLADFTNRYENVCVLTGSIIPEAVGILTNAGWESTDMTPYPQKHYKIIKAGLQAQPVMPNGRVIALCSTDFYQVQRKPQDYRDQMRYFAIELDDQRNLKTPIITDFNYEGYVGVFFNKTLVAENKAKYLFENRTTDTGLFILGKIEPKAQQLRDHDDFFDVDAQLANTSQNPLGFFAAAEIAEARPPQQQQLFEKEAQQSNTKRMKH